VLRRNMPRNAPAKTHANTMTDISRGVTLVAQL
jgi:hypothetical protein